MPTDLKHNEWTFTNRVIISLIAINIFIGIYAAMMGGATFGINCSYNASSPNNAVCGLQNRTQSILSSSNSLIHSFDNATSSPLIPQPISNGMFASVQNAVISLENSLIPIPNFAWHIGNAIWQLIMLMGNGIYFIVFFAFGFVPSLFTSSAFGQFASLASMILIFSVLALILYGLYILVNFVKTIFHG